MEVLRRFVVPLPPNDRAKLPPPASETVAVVGLGIAAAVGALLLRGGAAQTRTG
jgi:hypothetical protein